MPLNLTITADRTTAPTNAIPCESLTHALGNLARIVDGYDGEADNVPVGTIVLTVADPAPEVDVPEGFTAVRRGSEVVGFVRDEYAATAQQFVRNL